MPRFTLEAKLVICVDAENEQKAQKLAWALMEKRIDEQQLGLQENYKAYVQDWTLDTNLVSNNEDAEEIEAGDGGGEQGSKRGFAAMDPEKRRDIARKGGESNHGGRGGGRRSESGNRELDAMQKFLDTHADLPEKGRREIEEAIDNKRAEIEQSQQH